MPKLSDQIRITLVESVDSDGKTTLKIESIVPSESFYLCNLLAKRGAIEKMEHHLKHAILGYLESGENALIQISSASHSEPKKKRGRKPKFKIESV